MSKKTEEVFADHCRSTTPSPPHKPLQSPTLFTSVAMCRTVCPIKTKEGADGAVEQYFFGPKTVMSAMSTSKGFTMRYNCLRFLLFV